MFVSVGDCIQFVKCEWHPLEQMKIAVLIHGVKRNAEVILEHNMRELEAFFAPLDPKFSTFIYTERRSWNERSLAWLHETMKPWDIQMIEYWEDESPSIKLQEEEIAMGTKRVLDRNGYHNFMPRMWFRRSRLFDRYLKRRRPKAGFEMVLQVRLFDLKITTLKPLESVQPNTLYHSVDTLFFGDHQTIQRLLLFGKLADQVVQEDIDFTSETFGETFRVYEQHLHDIRPIHSSEVQIWNYIVKHFPQNVNLRENITLPESTPDAYLKVRLFR